MGEPAIRRFKFNKPVWGSNSTRSGQTQMVNNYLVSNIVDFRVDFYVEEDGDTRDSTISSQPIQFMVE